MATSSPGPELTLYEIDQLKQTVEGPLWRNRLSEVQKAIVQILETTPELKGHFRNLYPRTDIKTIESIIEKINDHRRDGETSYDITCVEDLIGAQMICPYTDDLEPVLDWLYSGKGGRQFFQLVTSIKIARNERREREHKTGYRAYHICLKLKRKIVQARRLSEGSENDQFELQIKTSLEAAWDAKTHDVTYKARDTEPDLQEHMKLISNGLTAIDDQTILLRRRIQEGQTAHRELREGATRLLFYVALTDDQKKQLEIADKNIEQWQQTDADKFEKELKQYYQRNGINLTYTLGLALLALYQGNRYMQEQALSSASCLLSQAEEEKDGEALYSALRIRALLRWAFQKTRYAVDDMHHILEHSDELRDKNSFLYFVCELHEPKNADLEKAQRCLKELEAKLSSIIDIDINIDEQVRLKDTIGMFYIRFGKRVEELHKGLDIIREANAIAKETRSASVSDAFRAYHEYLFVKQLSKLLSER